MCEFMLQTHVKASFACEISEGNIFNLTFAMKAGALRSQLFMNFFS